MKKGITTIIYPVTDIKRARTTFATLLGTEPVMDQPYYVQFDAGGLEIGLDPNGRAQGMTGPVAYWQVADIHAASAALVAAGGAVSQPAKDVGGGKLVGSVKDAEGNVIGLIQPARGR